MNFLSHYYFDKNETNSNIVLGSVLPDLVKNANKDWNLYPQKKEEIFTDLGELLILNGWKRHLEIDLIFHSSPFFFNETAALKQKLVPILIDTPVRPSFLAHIGLELLLDHILVERNLIKIESFYQHLANIETKTLSIFLNKSGIADFETFAKFFEQFKSSKYLISYQKLENISYALRRICMRLWPKPFEEETATQLTEVLTVYKQELEAKFMFIFEEIESRLNN